MKVSELGLKCIALCLHDLGFLIELPGGMPTFFRDPVCPVWCPSGACEPKYVIVK